MMPVAGSRDAVLVCPEVAMTGSASATRPPTRGHRERRGGCRAGRPARWSWCRRRCRRRWRCRSWAPRRSSPRSRPTGGSTSRRRSRTSRCGGWLSVRSRTRSGPPTGHSRTRAGGKRSRWGTGPRRPTRSTRRWHCRWRCARSGCWRTWSRRTRWRVVLRVRLGGGSVRSGHHRAGAAVARRPVGCRGGLVD